MSMKKTTLKQCLKIPELATAERFTHGPGRSSGVFYGHRPERWGEKMAKNMKEISGEFESALFQIHALAELLETEAAEGTFDKEGGAISNPVLSLSEVIGEKAAFCLKDLGCIS